MQRLTYKGSQDGEWQMCRMRGCHSEVWTELVIWFSKRTRDVGVWVTGSLSSVSPDLE